MFPRSAILLICVCAASLVSRVTSAQEIAAVEKSDTQLSSMSWDDVVEYYLRPIDEPMSAEQESRKSFRKTLLDREGISQIQVMKVIDGHKEVTGNIYYKAGELHIIDSTPGAWNLVVGDGKAYEWITGESDGIVSQQTNKDMIDYLIYITDVSLIPTYVYGEYLRRPELFHSAKKVEHDQWTELRFKSPNAIGMTALFVSNEPFWIYGSETSDADKTIRVIHDQPRSIDKLPCDLFESLNKIEFEKSDTSLRRHLVFL